PHLASSHRLRGVAVPHLSGPADPCGIPRQAWLEVVQQCLERADVQDRQPLPVLGAHPAEYGEGGRLGLATGGGGEEERIMPGQDRSYCLFLERSERRPSQRVDDVVLDNEVQLTEPVL